MEAGGAAGRLNCTVCDLFEHKHRPVLKPEYLYMYLSLPEPLASVSEAFSLMWGAWDALTEGVVQRETRGGRHWFSCTPF